MLVTCQQCGLLYFTDEPEDSKGHKKRHDEVLNGLPAPRLTTDRIIWEHNHQRITVVNSQSPIAQKKRAERIGRLSRLDTQYDFCPYYARQRPDDRNVHVFLGYDADRGIALFLLEKRAYIRKCTWKEFEERRIQELPDHPPMWSIGLAWVHRAHRRQGWARRLAEQVSAFFGLAVQSLGWYTPFTDDGEAMIRHLCPDSFYIAT